MIDKTTITIEDDGSRLVFRDPKGEAVVSITREDGDVFHLLGLWYEKWFPVWKPLDKVYWNDPDGGLCSKHGTIDIVDGDKITLQDGTECLAHELTPA